MVGQGFYNHANHIFDRGRLGSLSGARLWVLMQVTLTVISANRFCGHVSRGGYAGGGHRFVFVWSGSKDAYSLQVLALE